MITQRRSKKKAFFILVGGITFLVLMTMAATLLDTLVPRQPTPALQIVHTDLYQITLQVSPNPPPITQTALLGVQILHQDTQQLVTNARVHVEESMESMDMGTDSADAQIQPDGYYTVHEQFSMSGPWLVYITITVPGAKIENASFEVTAQ